MSHSGSARFILRCKSSRSCIRYLLRTVTWHIGPPLILSQYLSFENSSFPTSHFLIHGSKSLCYRLTSHEWNANLISNTFRSCLLLSFFHVIGGSSYKSHTEKASDGYYTSHSLLHKTHTIYNTDHTNCVNITCTVYGTGTSGYVVFSISKDDRFV